MSKDGSMLKFTSVSVVSLCQHLRSDFIVFQMGFEEKVHIRDQAKHGISPFRNFSNFFL